MFQCCILILVLWSLLYAAMNNADYTLESIFVTFTSGQNQSYNNKKCKTITVLDDSILEYNESFTLSLVATHPVITGAINKTTVVIMEDPSDCKFASNCNHNVKMQHPFTNACGCTRFGYSIRVRLQLSSWKTHLIVCPDALL